MRALGQAVFVIFIVQIDGERQLVGAHAVALGNEQPACEKQHVAEHAVAVVILQKLKVCFIHVFAHETRVAFVALRLLGKHHGFGSPIFQRCEEHELFFGIDFLTCVFDRYVKGPVSIALARNLIMDGQIRFLLLAIFYKRLRLSVVGDLERP